ncbi:cytochrome P450 [Gloeocapsopsis dulcis]|uniref:Cytochrome P450 n=1 Tax=Gloeocapsopsis dulcis AAB1 = 1H9 TaxID=1433147 RepID=A0A6N8FVX0_9CHRO|nr:cytochrome P450 [Gloeocapsopsis dulcis]MUL36914.1 cytochrome P450 [Gloeocapsopsis dulcis AAB1 = 1H9]WNN88727.1 cytochrome P450 [Gloeocapsopsis dulcis]
MPTVHLPPGPKGHFLIGNILEVNRDPLNFCSQCARNYGDIVRWQLGPFPAIMLNHPSLIEEVLVTQQQNFVKSSVYRRGLRVLGNGLLTSEGNFWQRQRRLVQPAFHQERIAAYAQVMVTYANRLLDSWQDGSIRDLHQDMMSLTSQVVSKALFNIDIAGEISGVQAALNAVMDFNAKLSNQYLLPIWVPTPSNLRYQKAIQQLDEIVYDIIDQRRASGKDTGDLLSLLLQVRDEGDGTQMTNQQVRDEAMTLFLAGHETTANAMTWTWFLLSQHTQVEAKLQEELQTVLGDRTPTVADLRQLRYTEQVVLEAMRLYPPVWGMSRVARHDCVLGGYDVKAGTTVFMSQWNIHRDSRFFEQPEVFYPERWADNQIKRLPHFAYFPFGGGQHICIGKAFAMMEAILLLATLASKFRLTLQPNHPVVLQPSLTLRPQHGIKMLLKRR